MNFNEIDVNTFKQDYLAAASRLNDASVRKFEISLLRFVTFLSCVS